MCCITDVTVKADPHIHKMEPTHLAVELEVQYGTAGVYLRIAQVEGSMQAESSSRRFETQDGVFIVHDEIARECHIYMPHVSKDFKKLTRCKRRIVYRAADVTYVRKAVASVHA